MIKPCVWGVATGSQFLLLYTTDWRSFYHTLRMYDYKNLHTHTQAHRPGKKIKMHSAVIIIARPINLWRIRPPLLRQHHFPKKNHERIRVKSWIFFLTKNTTNRPTKRSSFFLIRLAVTHLLTWLYVKYISYRNDWLDVFFPYESHFPWEIKLTNLTHLTDLMHIWSYFSTGLVVIFISWIFLAHYHYTLHYHY